MKKIFVLLTLCIPLAVFCQNGVYLTFEDFQNGKLTDEHKNARVEQLGGKYTLHLSNPGEKSSDHSMQGIWGYRVVWDGVATDFRIINNLPRAIYARGKAWLFAGYVDKFYKDRGQLFFQFDRRTYPLIAWSANGETKVLHTYKDVITFLNVSKNWPVQNCSSTRYLEDIVDCYNAHQKAN